jgi:hypothetical protein
MNDDEITLGELVLILETYTDIERRLRDDKSLFSLPYISPAFPNYTTKLIEEENTLFLGIIRQTLINIIG